MNAELRKLIDAVEAEMHQQREFGAEDTEPDSEMQVAMMRALLHGDVEFPRNGQEWQLFTSSMDCEDAAYKLTVAVEPLIHFIADNRGDAGVQHDVRDFCWRVG